MAVLNVKLESCHSARQVNFSCGTQYSYLFYKSFHLFEVVQKKLRYIKAATINYFLKSLYKFSLNIKKFAVYQLY